MKSSRRPSKWQVVENMVAAIEALRADGCDATVVRKARVRSDRDAAVEREVDVLVRIKSLGRTLSVGVDVKNEARPIGLPTMEALVKKWQSAKGSIDRYCVVSTSGFAESAIREAVREGVQTSSLLEARGVLQQTSVTKRCEFQRLWFRCSEEDEAEVKGRLGTFEEIVIVFKNGSRKTAPELVQELINHAPPLCDPHHPAVGQVRIGADVDKVESLECEAGTIVTLRELRFDFQVARSESEPERALRFNVAFGLPEVEFIEATTWYDDVAGLWRQTTAIGRPLSEADSKEVITQDGELKTAQVLFDVRLHHGIAVPPQSSVARSEETSD